ncbi:MAG: RNA polymerase sigma factor [Planctomycetota bacterium]
MDSREKEDESTTPLSRERIGVLVEQHHAMLRTYVRGRASPLVRSRESLSDIVQSTLRELCEDAGGLAFSSEAAFLGWLYTVAAHKIVSKHRYHSADRRASRLEVPIPEDSGELSLNDSRSPTRSAARREDLERLAAAIGCLGERDRQIFVMRKLYDVPASRIAVELGIAESTVRGRLRAVMIELASRLQP